ncbi:MAG: calcium-binding protein, partial [Sedimenticola sp.]
IRSKSNPDGYIRIERQYSSDGMSIETLQFDNGSSISLSNNVVTGTDSDDWLDGTDGDDMLIGGAGYNFLRAGSGDDIYLVDLAKSRNVVREEAGTDTIRLTDGINLGDVDFSREGDDLLISLKSNPDNFARIEGQYSSDGMSIETLQFDDGSSINLSIDIIGADSNMLFGTDGDDLLIGGAGNNILYGGSGDDIFHFDSLSDSSLEAIDTIVDFNQNEDVIDLHKLHIAYSDLVITEQDQSTTIEVEGTDFVIKLLQQHGDLLPEHFIF